MGTQLAILDDSRIQSIREHVVEERPIPTPEDPFCMTDCGEEYEQYIEFFNPRFEEMRPCTMMEADLVERIIQSQWRLNQLALAESEIINYQSAEQSQKHCEAAPEVYRRKLQYMHAPMLHGNLEKEQETLDRAVWCYERKEDIGLMGPAFVEDAKRGNALLKLSKKRKIEVDILHKHMNMLHRLQKARRNPNNPTLSVDLNVTRD